MRVNECLTCRAYCQGRGALRLLTALAGAGAVSVLGSAAGLGGGQGQRQTVGPLYNAPTDEGSESKHQMQLYQHREMLTH
jgi:hypothetical protein